MRGDASSCVVDLGLLPVSLTCDGRIWSMRSQRRTELLCAIQERGRASEHQSDGWSVLGSTASAAGEWEGTKGITIEKLSG
jgi:hypothetical protein